MLSLAILSLMQTGVTAKQPGYFAAVLIGSLILGGLGWLIAAVLGFARARAFGAATRWFSFAAVCLLLFHVQILVFGFGMVLQNRSIVFPVLTFFNLFIVLAAVCAIMGFVRLTNPR